MQQRLRSLSVGIVSSRPLLPKKAKENSENSCSPFCFLQLLATLAALNNSCSSIILNPLKQKDQALADCSSWQLCRSWQTFAIFSAFADVAITLDLATFATRVALATLVAHAALATLVACALLATLMVLQMLPLVVRKHRQQQLLIKLEQEYEVNKQLIQS